MATAKSTNNSTTRPSKLPVRSSYASSASIISSMTTAMPPTTNQNTIAALPDAARRAAHITRNVQCTHLTTTRLFTKEFRCGVCFRESSFGWVWRCTQDRELMLEDDMDHGHASQEKLDDLCDIFPKPTLPKPRGPEARKSRLSFLDEITSQDLKNGIYSPAQIQTILKQRSNLLDVLANCEEPELTTSPSASNIPRFLFNPFSRPLAVTSQTTPNMRLTNQRPWLPSRGGECQFKCCHTCRPSLLDRSYLSLNAIANDDLPYTAITGFGFNLQKFRPVGDVEIVKNLGLRPSPVPVSTPGIPRSRNLRYQRRANHLGLGIVTDESRTKSTFNSPTPSCSPPATHSSNSLPKIQTKLSQSDFSSDTPSSTPGSFPTSSTDSDSACSETSAYPFPCVVGSSPANRASNHTNPFKSTSPNVLRTHPVLVPLPPQTPSEVAFLAAPTTPTLMEESESEGHFFGSAPLEVEDGVAVMEEGVGLHVPDVLISQY